MVYRHTDGMSVHFENIRSICLEACGTDPGDGLGADVVLLPSGSGFVVQSIGIGQGQQFPVCLM